MKTCVHWRPWPEHDHDFARTVPGTQFDCDPVKIAMGAVKLGVFSTRMRRSRNAVQTPLANSISRPLVAAVLESRWRSSKFKTGVTSHNASDTVHNGHVQRMPFIRPAVEAKAPNKSRTMKCAPQRFARRKIADLSHGNSLATQNHRDSATLELFWS